MTYHHPREGGRKKPFSDPIDRRSFLRRTGLTAASLPLASAVLAACGTPDTSGGLDEAGQAIILDPARPDNPVTLPTDGNELIADGLKPEAGPLEIYNWEEYVNPRVVAMFEEKYGVKVNVNTFNTGSDAMATLTTSPDLTFDVFMGTTIDMVGKLAVTKIARPLNKSYIPNLENMWSEFHGTEANTPFYDVGAQYTVPYTAYTTGVAWRIDQPRGADIAGPGPDEVDSWDILWDERWGGKIHLLDDYRECIAMALLKNGITDVNTDDVDTRAQNLALAQKELLDLVARVDAKFDISDYTDLPEGQSLIHHAWGGDMVSAQYYFPDYQEDKDVIRYWRMDENMPINNDCMMVLNTGKNPVLAHLFLDFMMEFDEKTNGGASIVNFQFNGYLPPLTKVSKDDLIKGRGAFQPGRVVQPSLESALPTREEFEVGTLQLELTPDVDSQWKAVWETIQSAG